MRAEWRILSGAAVEGVMAALLPVPWGLPVAWVALVTGSVGIAILFREPRIMGKRPDGSFPLWSYLALGPWHLASRLAAVTMRRVGPDPPASEVHPGWWIGSWPHPSDLPSPDVAVLDMTCELPRRVPDSAAYLCLPTWDGTAPNAYDLARGVAWLHEARARGPVLIHCAHGRGRCATMMVAALVDAGLHPTWQDALEHVRSRREVVHPNREQRAALAARHPQRDV